MTASNQEISRTGVVSIVGRPNVGKSTLLNTLLQEKISIVTKIPQTTRHQIRGIYNDDRGQIIFIDTPGLHLGRDKLDKYMNQMSMGTIEDADCLVYLVDVTRRVGQEEENIANTLAKVKVPVVLGLNKIDCKGEYVPDYIALWEQSKGCPVNEMKKFTLMTMSAKKGKYIDTLLEILFQYLPQGPALYPVDTVSDAPQKLMIADIIREKLFLLMREEVPHSIGVVIEDMQMRKKKVNIIKALIYVDQDSQKEIVIGRKGQTLKKAGTMAREDLEKLLDAKVFLELRVKTKKRWRDNLSILEELGYRYV